MFSFKSEENEAPRWKELGINLEEIKKPVGRFLQSGRIFGKERLKSGFFVIKRSGIFYRRAGRVSLAFSSKIPRRKEAEADKPRPAGCSLDKNTA